MNGSGIPELDMGPILDAVLEFNQKRQPPQLPAARLLTGWRATMAYQWRRWRPLCVGLVVGFGAGWWLA